MKSSQPVSDLRVSRHVCSNTGHLCSRGIANRSKVSHSFSSIPSRNVSLSKRSAKVAGFTLVEAMIALGVLVLFVAACLSSIVVNQVSVRKAKEEALVIDFITKYTENLKALPFTSVETGNPVNNLFNGVKGPLISIPASGGAVLINTAAYQTFYPDLLWLQNRNPTMTVTLTKNNIGGVLHDIEVNVKVDWDPPISKGGRQEVQVDFLRTKDVSQL